MKQKPLIGLTTEYDGPKRPYFYIGTRYIEAVTTAGGTPVALPHDRSAVEQLAATIDGLVSIGGLDIPPAWYGRRPHPTANTGPVSRAWFERELIEAMLELAKPVLGVCYGHQLMNVMFGGTLIQDIPSLVPGAIDHRAKTVRARKGTRHPINIEPDGHLRKILGTERIISVSDHHQAVGEPGPGVIVAARAADGIIEATEFPVTSWAVSIQWHPEAEPNSLYTKKLFAALVETAGAKRGAYAAA